MEVRMYIVKANLHWDETNAKKFNVLFIISGGNN